MHIDTFLYNVTLLDFADSSKVLYGSIEFKWILIELSKVIATLLNRENFNKSNIVEQLIVKSVGFSYIGARNYYNEMCLSRHRHSVTFW